MRKTKLKNRITSVLLALTFLFFVPCYADGAESIFSKDVDQTYLANQFGWDLSKMTADSWDVTYNENGRYVTETIDRSSQYTKDYYYDIFTTTKQYLGLRENKQSGGAQIAAVARAEVGAEGSVEAPPGSNNVKYNTWYYGHAVSGPDWAWCAVFVTWCAAQCGYLESGYGEDLAEPLFLKSLGYGCGPMYRRFVGEMGFEHYPTRQCSPYCSGGYVPVPGDIIFFSEDPAQAIYSTYTHIGIVVEVTEDAIHVVEGNCQPYQAVHEMVYTSDYVSSPSFYNDYYYSQIVHVIYPASEGAAGVYNFLRTNLGLNDAATLGIMISMDNESHIIADKLERENPGYYFPQGYGLCGWTDSQSGGFYLWGNLRTYCIENGYNWTTYEGQLWYLKFELEEGGYDHESRFRTCYSKLLAAEDSHAGAIQAAMDWAIYHQGGGTFITPQGYGALMGQRIDSYGAWPDVQQWASQYDGGRTDHELKEEYPNWVVSLFEGTENWSGQAHLRCVPPGSPNGAPFW